MVSLACRADYARMGQTAHRLVAAGSAAALLAGLLSSCGGSPSAVHTVVQNPISATVMDVSGHVRPAYDGEVLKAGEVVTPSSATTSSALLDTGGRAVYLRPSSAWQVGDGVHGVLRTGAAVIDD